MRSRRMAIGAALLATANWSVLSIASTRAADRANFETLGVLFAQNRSFDYLDDLFPGANGIASATPAQVQQRDHDGNLLSALKAIGSRLFDVDRLT